MHGEGVYSESWVEETEFVDVVDHAEEDGRDQGSVVGQSGEVVVDGDPRWCSALGCG